MAAHASEGRLTHDRALSPLFTEFCLRLRYERNFGLRRCHGPCLGPLRKHRCAECFAAGIWALAAGSAALAVGDGARAGAAARVSLVFR
jgi:hypothetical protein